MGKKIFLVFFILITSLFSQTNSVELRTKTGTLVSTHSSIQEAYNAIPSPMTQGYIIEILPAYNQSNETIPITLGAKADASSTNSITIRPKAGHSGVVISANSSSGIININDGDFITIDGRAGGVGNTSAFKIENLATTGTNANTILLNNGATNNTLMYLHTVNNTQNTAGPRNIMLGTSTTVGNSKNSILFCKIQGGRSGIGLAGSSNVPNDSIEIKNCEIFNWGYAGIWIVSGQLNTIIDSNKIYQTVGVNNTLVSGIIMSTIAGATYNIRKNWIYDLRTTSTSSSSLRGIYAAGPAASSIINIENNIISNTLDNGTAGQTVTGIEFLGSNNYILNIIYNTILIGGTHTGGTTGATTSAGIRIGASAAKIFMKNNIAINKRTGGNVNHCGFVLTSTTGILDIDFNCYYAQGTNSFSAYWGTTGYNDIVAYKTAVAPHEQHTIFKDVSFVSNIDLHLTGSSISDNDLIGLPYPEIPVDFDNDLRSASSPFRGADEPASSGNVTNVTFNTDSLWNIVAVPGNTNITHKDSLFEGNISPAYWFDGTTYTAITNLSNGKGYWLKFQNPKTHTIAVQPVAPLSINLNAGWNMIGGIHQDVPVSSITSTPPGIIVSSFYGYNKGYEVATSIQKGKGYWIKLNAQGSITIPATFNKNENSLNYIQQLPETKILITDAVNNSQTLYFSPNNINSDLFELPPPPPQNIFDVRFYSNKLVEDNIGEKIVSINSAVYPITIKSEGLSLEIKDLLDGKLFNAKVSSGEKIVINNPKLNLLKISSIEIPLDYSISQNYPNPFNPTTTITYQIPDLCNVEIKVIDILGRVVETLVNKPQSAGKYSVEWDGSKYASGTYFYEFKAGDFRAIKKMLLLK